MSIFYQSLLGTSEITADLLNVTTVDAVHGNFTNNITNTGTLNNFGNSVFHANVGVGGNLTVAGSVNMENMDILNNLTVEGDTTINVPTGVVVSTDGLLSSVTPLPIASGGTGLSSVSSGYLKSNGTSIETVYPVPFADVDDLGTIAQQNYDAVYVTGGSVKFLTELSSVDTQTSLLRANTVRALSGTVNIGDGFDNVNLKNAVFTQGSYNLAPPVLVANRTIATTDDLNSYLVKSNNLSDITSSSTARTNLGLGTMSVQNSNSVSISGGSVTATLNANGAKITNCLDPTSSSEVATKNYVDTHVATGAFVKRDGTTPLTGGWWAGAFPATFNSVEVGSAANTVTGLSKIINTGTLILPTSSDTLVGRATTDTLTNKTLIGPIVASNSLVYNLGTSGGGTFHYSLQNGGSLRFVHGLAGTESGSNNGSNFSIWRYDDSGSFLGTAMQMTRSNGNIYLGGYLGVQETSPQTPLHVSTSGTSGLLHSARFFSPSLTAGSGNGTLALFGVAGSTLNSSYFRFNYSGGSGSTSNYTSIGFWGLDDLLKIDGNKEISIIDCNSANRLNPTSTPQTLGTASSMKIVTGGVNMSDGTKYPSSGALSNSFNISWSTPGLAKINVPSVFSGAVTVQLTVFCEHATASVQSISCLITNFSGGSGAFAEIRSFDTQTNLNVGSITFGTTKPVIVLFTFTGV